MRKAFFRSDYPMGYRMSDGTQNLDLNPLPNAENYYALALCVYEKMPSGKALNKMGISPEREVVIYESAPSRELGTLVYVLHCVCGVQQKVIAPMLQISKTTLRRALRLKREALTA